MDDWDSGWFGGGADDTDAWWGMGSDWSAGGDFDSAPSWASANSAWERVDISADNPEATGYDVFKDADSGKLLTITPSGQYWINDPATGGNATKIWDSGALERASPGLGGFINQFAKSIFVKDGKPNVPGILGLTAFLNSGVGKKLLGTGEAPKVGYQGSIPTYEAVRERVGTTYDPNRRPGSGGQRYFSDTRYVNPTKPEELAAARTAAAEQATGLAALNKANPAYETKPKVEAKEEKVAPPPTGLAAMPASKIGAINPPPKYAESGQTITQERTGPSYEVIDPSQFPNTGTPKGIDYDMLNRGAREFYELYKKHDTTGPVQSDTEPRFMPMPVSSSGIPADLEEAMINKPITAAGGGLMNLAKGRYLNGSTDGMADKIPANIEGKQPAKLSHGEFVIPADVVSHLGNGNSEAGAQRLYDMMDKIRHARTGTTKQGEQINPNKYLPA